MKLTISSILSMLAAFSLLSAVAQAEEKSTSALPLVTTPQQILSVVYKNAAIENQQVGSLSLDQIPSLGDDIDTSLKLKVFRQKSLSMKSFSSNMFVKDDRASFTVNVPTQEVNHVLSLVGTLYQAQVDSTVAKWAQVLSMVATRKINAEFAYSAKINKYSSIDSSIAYRFDAGSSGMAASIKYGIKF